MRTARPPLGAAALVGRSFRVVFAHFRFLFPLAFVPALALAALTSALSPQGSPAEIAPVAGPGAALALLAHLALGFVVTGVMCLAALDALLGKRHTIGAYLAQTLRHLPPIVVLGALVSIAAGLGILLAIVPGLYILARFIPWAPAVVFENAGWSGLGRAQDLTEGYRWPLVGAVLLLGLALVALVLALAPVTGALAGTGWPAVLVEGGFAGFYYALIATFTALVYLRLREIKEGATIAEIAASID